MSGRDQSIGGEVQPLMWTDSDALMRQGVHAAKEIFPRFLEAVDWTSDQLHRTFCHQIGSAHRRLLFDQLGLDPAIDYATVRFLGNTGSVALPITAALGIQNGFLRRGDHVALWGIGSGINVVALGVDWQTSLVDDEEPAAGMASAGCVDTAKPAEAALGASK